ncbi:5' nucleotidase, NT5C type [Undibacterium macrobrachii]|uniref:5' nucleotidase, NT5C type n=1 Tax=Undibacterium macrobrachii TaxID=1119058 RepID=UPI0027E54DAE|nr:hypothetical protein [Undibacterium macrobrachii]
MKNCDNPPNPIIALDADGVLLDYNAAYRKAWEKAFGELPALRDANAYWAMDRWGVNRLTGKELEQFRASFDESFWNSIPALPSAVSACEALCAAGFELVCVSAIDSHFQAARLQNLRDCGFPSSGWSQPQVTVMGLARRLKHYENFDRLLSLTIFFPICLVFPKIFMPRSFYVNQMVAQIQATIYITPIRNTQISRILQRGGSMREK